MIFNNPINPRRSDNPQKQNFGLSETNFNHLLQSLKKGKEDLIVHIYENHLPLSAAYLRKEFQVDKELAHEICLETLIELRTKFLLGKVKYGNLKFLFTRMAQNNLVDLHKRQKKLNESIRQFLNIEHHPTDTDHFLDLLNQAIEQLSVEEEKLITDLYLMDKNMKDLAVEYKISYSNMRKRKERVLKKLKEHFFIRYNAIG